MTTRHQREPHDEDLKLERSDINRRIRRVMHPCLHCVGKGKVGWRRRPCGHCNGTGVAPEKGR